MMTYYKGNTSGGIPGVLPGPPPNPTWGCESQLKLEIPWTDPLTLWIQTTGGNLEQCGDR